MKKTKKHFQELVDGGFSESREEALQAAEQNALSNLYWSIVKYVDGKNELKGYDEIDKDELKIALRDLLQAVNDVDKLVVGYNPENR